MRKLHPTQTRLLAVLEGNRHEALSIRDLQDELGISSPSVVLYHIRQLEDKGFLRRNPSNPRDYEVVLSKDARIAYLNLYGFAQCGPNGSFLDDDPIDRIPISTKILGFPSVEAFLLRARGNSMSPKIKSKDLVLAKRAKDAPSGSVVVCINNGETLIKKIRKTDKGAWLISENAKFEPFPVSEDFRIEGIVRGVISYYS